MIKKRRQNSEKEECKKLLRSKRLWKRSKKVKLICKNVQIREGQNEIKK